MHCCNIEQASNWRSSARSLRPYVQCAILILDRPVTGAVLAPQACEAHNCHDYPPTAIVFMTALNRKLRLMVFGLLNTTTYVVM